MSGNNSFINSVKHACRFGYESLPVRSLVEICDQRRVLIEHHFGIVDYGCCEISVAVSFGSVCICGENLKLRLLSKEKLVVTGKICGVTLHREKRI